MLVPRVDGRQPSELRSVRIVSGFQAYAEGSVLIETGQTRVVCAVSVEERLPAWLRGEGRGWVTAEYAMLPRSTLTRTPRERNAGPEAGRSQEIQRLIGRSLRAVADLSLFGERTFTVDCDVLQADGGTRTASITGAYVALYQALDRLWRQGAFPRLPLTAAVAAVSVGIVRGQPLLDLCYEEDVEADSDFTVVMTSRGELVEVQGTAERHPFTRKEIDGLLDLAQTGLRQLFRAQEDAIAAWRGV
ncbi:MAG: ribonuclease PH [Chloroflexi bacterium]|nr:ribonuclease PH [Chloroflexota bacterium]